MADDLLRDLLQLVPPLAAVDKALDRTTTRARNARGQFVKAGEGAEQLARSADNSTASLNRLSRSLSLGDSALGRFTGKVDGFLVKQGAAFLRWTKLAAAGLVALGARSAFNFARNLEQAQVAITTILGSKADADRLIGELKTFARQTPFNFEQLVASSQMLLANGFRQTEITPTLTALGDASAALGLGNDGLERMIRNLGQISAGQRLATRDMNDFTTTGLPIWELMSKKLGVTTGQLRDMISTAGGGAKVFEKLGGREGIVALIGERFAGGMDAQATTFNGIWSNVVDSFNQGMEPLFTAAMTKGKGIAKRLGDSMAANLPLAFAAFKRGDTAGGAGLLSEALLLGDDGKQVILTVISTARSLWPVVRTTGEFVMGMAHGFAFLLEVLRPLTPILPVLVVGITGLLVVERVSRFVDRLGRGLQILTGATKAQAGAQWLLNTAMAANPLVLAAAAVAALTVGFVLLYQRSDAFRALVYTVGQVAGAAFGWVADKVRDVWDWMGRLLDRARDLAKNPFVRAALGAVAGGVVAGPIGALVGGVGAVAIGDRSTPAAGHHGTPRGFDRSHLSRTVGLYGRASAMTPGRQVLTSTVRGYGLGSPSSAHPRGRAFDAAGSNLPTLARNIRAVGGHAELHGYGPSRHVHAEAIGDRATPVMGGGAAGASVMFAAGAVQVLVHGDVTRVDAEWIGEIVASKVGERVRDEFERGARS